MENIRKQLKTIELLTHLYDRKIVALEVTKGSKFYDVFSTQEERENEMKIISISVEMVENKINLMIKKLQNG